MLLDIAQWIVVGGWILFSLWIFFGSGWKLMVRTMSVFCGVFAEEAAFRVFAVPEWFAVTLIAASLLIVLQVLWARCRTTISTGESGWKWKGRRGPERPASPTWAIGGGWCREAGGRWFFIPKGFTNGDGLDWWKALKQKPKPGLMSAVSPALFFLLLMLAGAFVAAGPFKSFRKDTGTIRWKYGNEGKPAVRKALDRHPELKPYALFVSTLPACAKRACLEKQTTARMEMDSIGPFYGMGRGILTRLLILQGKGRMAEWFSGKYSLPAFELAVRTGKPKRAREILRHNPGIDLKKRGGDLALLFLEEGFYDDALALAKKGKKNRVYRNLSLLAVAASLAGDCEEVKKNLIYLYLPSSQTRIELGGEVPALGLGALERASKVILEHASRALALMVDGQQTEAESEWSAAEREARAAGIPGVIDRDRVLMELLEGDFTGINDSSGEIGVKSAPY